MHAIHAHAVPVCAKNKALGKKAAIRRHSNLHYNAALAQFCETLVAADLTATAYRVVLDTLARMIRRGTTSEAVGNEFVASRLKVGRNAVSAAFSALEKCLVLTRVPVKHRGAPTRTRLLNIAALLVDRSIPSEVLRAVEVAARSRVSTHSSMERVVEPGSLTPLDHVADPVENQQNQAQGRVQTPDVLVPCGAAVAADDSSNGNPKSISVTERFVFNATVNASMAIKVPKDDREQAMRCRSPMQHPIKSEWNLTKDEADHYLRLFPKPEPPLRSSGCTMAVEKAKPIIPSADMASALRYAHRRLRIVTGSDAAAATLADQIAFQVSQGLGKGDILFGFRAGISMVSEGRWTQPRRFASAKSNWEGITARAVTMASLPL